MKDIPFHLPNEELECLESFVLVFLCTYYVFTYMVQCKGSAVICFDAVKIRYAIILKMCTPWFIITLSGA